MRLDPQDLGRLRDMADFAQEAVDLLGHLTVEEMAADRRTFLAVSRCIEVVGEAGWKLSDGVKSAHSTIPWPLIAGMRHRLVHDYGRVDLAIVHKVITVHLPSLIAQVLAILADHGEDPPTSSAPVSIEPKNRSCGPSSDLHDARHGAAMPTHHAP